MNNTDAAAEMRRALQAAINAPKSPRDELAAEHGQTWDTPEMQAEFQVLGFAAPYVVVERRADGKKGSLLFQHSPRIYFSFSVDE
jgi:hypothetical protein